MVLFNNSRWDIPVNFWQVGMDGAIFFFINAVCIRKHNMKNYTSDLNVKTYQM